jgi:hypothetical protein
MWSTGAPAKYSRPMSDWRSYVDGLEDQRLGALGVVDADGQ